MIETCTNGAAHRPVGRAGRGRRTPASDAAAAPSTNGDNGERGGATAPPQGTEGRDARGRFAPGNAGGPGNPFARRVAQFRRVLCETVTDEDIQAVARALIVKAQEGDVAAARLLFSYTIGQPAPAVDPDTLDLAEWDIYRRTPAKVQDLEGVAGFPAALACKLAGILTPCVYDRAAKTIAAELRADEASADAPAGTGQAAGIPSTNRANGNGNAEAAGAPSTNEANGSATRRARTAAPSQPGRRRDRAASTKKRRTQRIDGTDPPPAHAGGSPRENQWPAPEVVGRRGSKKRLPH